MRRECGMRNAEGGRGGFTLVELLAVLVIIGILVGLIAAAVVMARTRARVAKINMEVYNLGIALSQSQTGGP